MGFLDKVKAWLGQEAAELADVRRGAEARIDADLGRREARLDETPEQAMERIQAEMAANDDSLDAIRDRISGTGARAEAERDLDPPPSADPR